MKIPIIDIIDAQIIGLRVSVDLLPQDKDGTGIVHVDIVDEGGGHFAEISRDVTSTPLRVTGEQLVDLGEWITAACEQMDEERAAVGPKS